MITIFFEGFFLGIGAAVPLGPINILIMNEALKNYKKAVAIGFGAMSADISYLLLILLGITTFFQDQMALQVLSLIGGVFLIYLAFLIFKGRNKEIHKTKVSKKNSILGNYVKGYLLTLLNPYTILFWLSVTTYSTTTESLAMTLFGMVSALVLWITIMPYLVYRSRDMISNAISSKISIISALILLGFGLSLFVKGFYS